MRKYRKWRDILIEQLDADPTAAIEFLQAVMEDYQVFGNPAAVVSAVQAVVEAQGGVAEVAKRTSMDPQTFTKMLSNENVPQVDTLRIILTALGCRLSIEPLAKENIQPNPEFNAEQESTQSENSQIPSPEAHASQ